MMLEPSTAVPEANATASSGSLGEVQALMTEIKAIVEAENPDNVAKIPRFFER